MTYSYSLACAAKIARRGFKPIIADYTQRLYRALDERIKSPRDPEAIRRHEAARREEQRFGDDKHFGGKLAKLVFDDAPARFSLFKMPALTPVAAAVRAVMPTRREGNARASAPRTRTTGSNAKKAASGSGGTDPDPERPHAFNPASILSFAAFCQGGAA